MRFFRLLATALLLWYVPLYGPAVGANVSLPGDVPQGTVIVKETLPRNTALAATPAAKELTAGKSDAIAKNNSNFALVKLPRGIALQIPKGWWLLGADINGQSTLHLKLPWICRV